jgi:uncharacterized protein (TIGR03435 family)
MKWTKRKALAGALMLVLLAVALVVKLVFFPSVKDACFAMDPRGLQQAPAGLAIVRPTHFAFLRGEGILSASSPHRRSRGEWMMGRNAPLRAVIGVAYGQNPSHVVMPADAPAGNFDFLVTTANHQRERLQSVIHQQFGYVAQKETRDTAVLALKVIDRRLPGLTISGAGEKPDIEFMDYEIQFKHVPVSVLANGLDRHLPTPVVDETGLTNFYDFSFPWNSRTDQHLENGDLGLAEVNRMLAQLGLGLKPATVSLEMLLVKRAN